MINFTEITYKNFLSVGDMGVTLLLDKSPTTAISGSNGAGKSTFLCALCFVLFGKSYRGVNKASLINTVNKGGCTVTIKFNKGPDEFVVTRSIKPNAFVILKNGVEIQNEAAARDQQKYFEENILGFGMRAFTQTCILGTASYIPFMQLPAGARREVIENLLDIGIYGDMHRALKVLVRNWKEEYNETEGDLRAAVARMDLLDKVAKREAQDTAARIQEHRDAIERIKGEAREIMAERGGLLQEYESNYDDSRQKTNTLQNTLSAERSKVAVIKSTANALVSDANFFKDNSQCPSCRLEIPHDHSTMVIEEIDAKIAELEQMAERKEEASSVIIQDLATEQERNKAAADAKNQYDLKTARLHEIKRSAIEHSEAIGQLQNVIESNNDDDKKKDYASQRADAIDRVAELRLDMKSLSQKKELYGAANVVLGEKGIKSSIIGQYIPLLNAKVNEYLTAMNFPVQFEMDENFNETIKTRHRTDLTYQSFSQGERQRVDLAQLFSWRDVARLKNSVNCNILILDEVLDASLDAGGTDDTLAILEDVSRETNVFVVSHKNMLDDKLRSSIIFGKVNGFTRII